jgi:hypothetical protein
VPLLGTAVTTIGIGFERQVQSLQDANGLEDPPRPCYAS